MNKEIIEHIFFKKVVMPDQYEQNPHVSLNNVKEEALIEEEIERRIKRLNLLSRRLKKHAERLLRNEGESVAADA
jgi:hypothetical protein